VTLITGAGGSIGRDIAIGCAEQGAIVYISDINEAEGTESVKIIQEQVGVKAHFKKVDIVKEEEVKAWIEESIKQQGGIDVLVNNAVAFVFGKVEDVTSEQWDRALGVNVKGYAICCKYVVPHMRKKKGGSIVNIASISSFIAQPAFVPYNTTKGAVLQLTRCMAMDLGADNIRVNAVCPGNIDTPATSTHAKFLGITKEELVQQALKSHFIKRFGTGRDVANAVIFLASDESTFITGTTLAVDGGYLAH